MTAVGKPGGGPAIIATDSGTDRETNTIPWAHGLAAFLFALIGRELDGGDNVKPGEGDHATIDEALAISGPQFQKNGTSDRFKLMQGDGSLQLIP